MTAAAPRPLPCWRSALFVPVNVERFVARAHQRGADAIVLDLEDSVAPAEKAAARALVAAAAARVGRGGADVVVRINGPLRLAVADLEAAAVPGVRAVMLPKVDHPARVAEIAGVLDELEAERSLAAGAVGILAEIETAAGLTRVEEIASAGPRLISAFLGGEDFALSMGMEPSEEGLAYPAQRCAVACRAAGIAALGFAGSIAEISDLEAFRRMVRRSRRLGFEGGFCVHPAQVAILNEEHTPAAAEAERAQGIVAAYAAAVAAGRGAARFEGVMIDAPVVRRAERTLALAARLGQGGKGSADG